MPSHSHSTPLISLALFHSSRPPMETTIATISSFPSRLNYHRLSNGVECWDLFRSGKEARYLRREGRKQIVERERESYAQLGFQAILQLRLGRCPFISTR
uniref:Uncharacterized protein n=1 Tax=Cannabis sativa TaxID=3483 RepID=A0A803P5S8_CANSA